MTYPVMLTDRAHVEMEAAYSWWAEHRCQAQAAQWYNAFADAIESLADHSDRCADSRESEHFPYEIRDLYFGIGRRRRVPLAELWPPVSSGETSLIMTGHRDSRFVFRHRSAAHSSSRVHDSQGHGLGARHSPSGPARPFAR